MRLNELNKYDDEPLLITIIRQRLEKGEPVSYESKEQNDYGSWQTKSYLLQSVKRLDNPSRTTLSFSGRRALELSIADELLEKNGWTLINAGAGWKLARGTA